MYDRYAAIAMLLLALGLCLWALRERRLRRWAEEERDLYEDEIVTAHERDDALARAREERNRARTQGATVTFETYDELTPVLEQASADIARLASATDSPLRPTSPACEVPSQREGAE